MKKIRDFSKKWPKPYTKTGVHLRHAISRILAENNLDIAFTVQSAKSEEGYGYSDFHVDFDAPLPENVCNEIHAHFEANKKEYGRTVGHDRFSRYPKWTPYYYCILRWH